MQDDHNHRLCDRLTVTQASLDLMLGSWNLYRAAA